MKIRYGSKLIDQIFIPGDGWRTIAPLPLRDLYKPCRSEIAPKVTGVHFVDLGDYLIRELTRRTSRRPAQPDPAPEVDIANDS